MTIEQIICFFCNENGVNTDEVCGRTKKLPVWTTRYMIWHYLHITHKISGGKLAKMFKRNLPSIFRGIRIIKHEMTLYKDLRSKYDSIVKKIEGIA